MTVFSNISKMRTAKKICSMPSDDKFFFSKERRWTLNIKNTFTAEKKTLDTQIPVFPGYWFLIHKMISRLIQIRRRRRRKGEFSGGFRIPYPMGLRSPLIMICVFQMDRLGKETCPRLVRLPRNGDNRFLIMFLLSWREFGIWGLFISRKVFFCSFIVASSTF